MVALPPSPQELRALRKKANLTQKELAIKAGVSQALVARIEAGDVDPRVSTLRKILTVLSDEAVVKKTVKEIMHTPVITIEEADSLENAIEKLWEYGISQMPVMRGDRAVGSVKEETILRVIKEKKVKDLSNTSIRSFIEESFPIVSIETDVDEAARILSSGYSAILVSEHGMMVGIVTKIDLIASHSM